MNKYYIVWSGTYSAMESKLNEMDYDYVVESIHINFIPNKRIMPETEVVIVFKMK